MTSLTVICGLGPSQSKIFATSMVTMVTYHQLVTSDAIGLLYVGLFFGLELVLVMIRVDCAKFKL